MAREVARWEGRGRDYLSLLSPRRGEYSYHGVGLGGVLYANSDQEAVARLEAGTVAALRADRPSVRRVR